MTRAITHARPGSLHDITLELSARTPTYPGDPPPVLERTSDLAAGDALTASHLSLGCHVGTHIDAPSHFLRDAPQLADLPLTTFYGPAIVLDLRGRSRIEPADLARASLPSSRHLLLKTDGSQLLATTGFSPLAPHLSPEAAAYLASLQPLSVGIDSYSLDPPSSSVAPAFPAHLALARSGIAVFVCLALGDVPPGRYTFAGLPLRLADAEGAPVRALLIADD